MSPFSINNDNTATNKHHIQSVLMNFLSVTPNDFDRASEHLELFISSSVPKSLVTLYMTHPYTKIAYIWIYSTIGTTGYVGLSFTLVRDFTAFVHPMWNVLRLMDKDTHEAKFYKKIGLPLCYWVTIIKKGDVLIVPWWSLYLDILKDLQNISKLRKLAMMMLPKVEDDEQDQYYMLIDRSKLLVDSFEYIAKLKNMPGSFFLEFKEEQTTGLTVDQDLLGLIFVCEVELLGLRREIELCPNGKDTVVDRKNRETYANINQVTYFLEDFSDVITMSRLPSFFRCLSLKDFNLMLGGRSDISVKDWKAHTNYHGYEESDLQISWFWKIVESMCIEQRKMLIFFWTSIKSLL
ncbi:hypothetical protein R3W88_032981 [Solanum pinnatisectum]|uniref:HECT-type E3 ubiquitin transferase n=1 Tax=Solanum pinnatisectum TaxID=50273 RepID=A0AAV9K463_9SOLN|nr:hypothetical protein R3W88_032981 [Solanum pinnatisectum]